MTEQELQALISKYLAGKGSPEEIKLLDALDALFEHAPEINIPDSQKQAIHGRILNRITENIQSASNTQSAWRKRTARDKQPAPVRQLWLRRISVAAAILILIGIGSGLYRQFLRRTTQRTAEYAEVIAGTGQQKKISLPDGSSIILNSGSKISFPKQFSDTSREVSLEGEAFFTIQKDEKRPFVVTSGRLTTRVLGTSFNVFAYRALSLLKIGVATGKVQVNEGSKVLATLTPGKEIVWHSNDERVEQLITDSSYIGDWQTGRLIFRQTPMEEIVNTLYNRFGVSIRIDNKAIRNYRITTQFDHNVPLKEMLDIITALNGTHYKMIGKDQALIN
jgi:transmembrane sensor